MKGTKKYVQLNLWRFPVLVLYSLFFTVQVFYNFDIAGATAGANNHSAVLAAKKEQSSQAFAAHSKSDKSQNSKIRLNKRFQPATCPLLNPFYVKAPVIFLEEPLPTIYTAPFHTSPTLFTRQLRGPPAVVYSFM